MDKKSKKNTGLVKILIGQLIFVGMFFVPIGQILIPISLFFIIFGLIQALKRDAYIFSKRQIIVRSFLLSVNVILFLTIVYMISKITG